MPFKPDILIRVDGGRAIGAGHVMRCRLLARSLRASGCQIHFVCRGGEAGYVDRLTADDFEVSLLPESATVDEDLAASIAIARKRKIKFCIVDHYDLDRNWEQGFRMQTGAALMALDDLGREHSCDVLHDQDLTALRMSRYAGTDARLVLLGPAYALLPDGLAGLRQQGIRDISNLRHIIVFMGGNDDGNETEIALQGLARTKWAGRQLTAILGHAHPARERIRKYCTDFPRWQVEDFVSDLPKRYMQADLSIGGGGMSLWERLALGLPSLVTVLADNQRDNATLLEAAGAIRLVGAGGERRDPECYAAACEALTSQELQQLSQEGMRLVDGKGLARTSEVIMQFLKE